ncbi:MAG TPA: Gfo/Idh/MocA family oxidoreductase, partial [Candidatus Omnitrophota bacterium]|nr:Gfo/Idh/MocA family oxidoreductase [Candidatus Omnitrophota bacterium]
MKILVVGYSRFVQNRVMPVLLAHPDISAVDIASRSKPGQVSRARNINEVFDDYDAAFSKSTADVVYVSTVNSAHAGLVKDALSKGKHVIVDKPAFTDLSDAEQVIDRARKSCLCVAEATIYAYHGQITAIKDQFTAAGCAPSRLIAVFSVPPLNADNFRYEAALGGGAMFDLGPYAVSAGRVFFGREEPVEIEARVTSRGGKGGVDISFSMLATYPGGRSMVGHFGFDTEYQNHLEVIGPGVSVKADRIFTTPANMEN